MKITILVDNNTLIDRYFYGEPGVSYFIETDNEKIIFDVGYSDIFLRNAQKMNIPLYNLDYLVLSHGHLDHTWGLDPLIKYYSEALIEKIPIKKPQIIAHPDVLNSKIIPEGEIGCLFSKEKLAQHFDIKLSSKPVWLSKNLVYLGEIPRENDFENKKPIGVIKNDNVEKDDYLKDDSALVYKSDNGLVIITGCSHSGICNIVEYAKKICGISKIFDIIGGFHLQNPSKTQLNGTINYFQTAKPAKIHACHCTDLNSKIALSQVTEINEVGVGLRLSYD
jgi:7,8-dihydropterin-6-yl-methyl-4-(beta-D-ribofuranosyl)aminobenzene 5'-phosphate synthase